MIKIKLLRQVLEFTYPTDVIECRWTCLLKYAGKVASLFRNAAIEKSTLTGREKTASHLADFAKILVSLYFIKKKKQQQKLTDPYWEHMGAVFSQKIHFMNPKIHRKVGIHTLHITLK